MIWIAALWAKTNSFLALLATVMAAAIGALPW